MAACQIHGENELGEYAARQLLELESHDDGALVALSNIYSKQRRWKEEEKKEAILLHSEKLALSYCSSIRIVKNLRICKDWLTLMKLASTVYEREIIVRDRTRFHHYKHGFSSCKDLLVNYILRLRLNLILLAKT
ncbi:pentatricopeptide repeat-containing protein [Pyrus ussuriensis x Pyrus communis]|uniref:Pentatricopeptide repeat-containing protein n=1 Tax=Pyrus ussuriensis x Pyrus communis TaxID=2448454 RepID=A0A5N5FCT0_9ROSA|nr:pentatricopeptide repeat-containing protein [Pyrus ussuriensis x Pyrus communis]